MIWANLLHLSFNMWIDFDDGGTTDSDIHYKPYLRFDETLWEDLLPEMVDAGVNMVVIDLGDGVAYDSHPEIAVENAWSVERLRNEVARLKGLGLEPIPKLNFSTSHDHWLGEYSRCVSSDIYYRVCSDLIEEITELFDKPRFFHIGMDEETAGHQASYEYVVIRQHELWWRDFQFYVDEVEKHGGRAWMWSDYIWDHVNEFVHRAPKSVVQSNWYYGLAFNGVIHAEAYNWLETNGFDQIPTGSNIFTKGNFELTAKYCKPRIDPKRLLGFLQTPWTPTLEKHRDHHMHAIEEVRRARAEFDPGLPI